MEKRRLEMWQGTEADMAEQARLYELRNSYIGGSDIGALLGINPYKTRLDLYHEKIGDVTPIGGNPHTRRGQKLEQAAADEYMEQKGCRVIRMNAPLVHPSYPYLRGHVDRRILLRDRIAEIKCPSLGVFSKIKREGLRADYIAQMQWYLGLGGYAGGTWIIFCADQWELLTFDVDPERELYERMVEEAVAFWQNHVIPRIPPAPEARDEALASELHGVGDTRITRNDPEFVEAMRLLHEAKVLKAESEAIEGQAKERVEELLGDAMGCFEGPGFRLYRRTQDGRVAFDKKALAGARPLDRLKVGAILGPMMQQTQIDDRQFELACQQIGSLCDLDLTQFEKKGQSFTTLRPYFGGE